MAYEVLMPQLGLTMEEGTVSQWIKHEGDAVKAGDVVVEITTDKLTNEITSEQDGVLLKIVAQEGEDVPVKGLLAYIGQPGEQVGETTAPAVSAASAALRSLRLRWLLPLRHPRRLGASGSESLPWPGRSPDRWAWTTPSSPAPAPAAGSSSGTSWLRRNPRPRQLLPPLLIGRSPRLRLSPAPPSR